MLKNAFPLAVTNLFKKITWSFHVNNWQAVCNSLETSCAGPFFPTTETCPIIFNSCRTIVWLTLKCSLKSLGIVASFGSTAFSKNALNRVLLDVTHLARCLNLNSQVCNEKTNFCNFCRSMHQHHKCAKWIWPLCLHWHLYETYRIKHYSWIF